MIEHRGELAAAIAIYESALAGFHELGDFDRASEMIRAIAVNKCNLDDRTCVAYGRAFDDRYGDRLSTSHRDGLRVCLGRLCGIQYDMVAAEDYLAHVERPQELTPRVRHNYLLGKQDIAAFEGDVAAWLSMNDELVGYVPALQAPLGLVVLYSSGQSASILGCTGVADAMFAQAEAYEHSTGYGAVRAYGTAVEALHRYLLGDLAGAKAASNAAGGSWGSRSGV